MSYNSYEQSTDDGAPVWLYRFATGDTVSRFAASETSISALGETWEPKAIRHGRLIYGTELRRDKFTVTLPLTDDWAQTMLPVASHSQTSVRLYRGHRDDPDGEYRLRFIGRVTDVRPVNNKAEIQCSTEMTGMRAKALLPRVQPGCRHALYGASSGRTSGCNLNRADWEVAGSVTAVNGRVLTVAAASGYDDGYFSYGILDYDGALALIETHTGSSLTVQSLVPGLSAEVASNGSASVSIAPGCDLTSTTCKNKFNNLLNFGGFEYIPLDDAYDGPIL